LEIADVLLKNNSKTDVESYVLHQTMSLLYQLEI